MLWIIQFVITLIFVSKALAGKLSYGEGMRAGSSTIANQGHCHVRHACMHACTMVVSRSQTNLRASRLWDGVKAGQGRGRGPGFLG